MQRLLFRGVRMISILTLCFCLMRCEEKHSLSFVQDIPDNLNTSSYNKIKKDFITQMKIDQIDSGYNGIQIRIIIQYAQSDTGHLLIFQNNSGNWTANFFEYYYVRSNESKSKIAKRELPILRKPKSGWMSFTKEINALGIMDLPDYSKIPDYYLPTDASSIVIEIATKKTYRIYSYPTISLYSNKIKEVDNVGSILLCIEKEFDFKTRKI
jgi:hypothetical protein